MVVFACTIGGKIIIWNGVHSTITFGVVANDQMTKSGTDANSVVVVLLLLLLSSSLSLFLFFNSTQTKNQYPTMEPVTEMLIWVLVPAFFIASATFLVYVYACEEPELKEE